MSTPISDAISASGRSSSQFKSSHELARFGKELGVFFVKSPNSFPKDEKKAEDEKSEQFLRACDIRGGEKETKARKRKFSDFDGELTAADTSLRARKRLAGEKAEDGIISNEDFKRIKELKAKKDARTALAQHGLLKKGSDSKAIAFKVPSSEQLSAKRVDPSKFEAHLKQKLNKEGRSALRRAGREETGKYQGRAAIKQKKTGGTSNQQKERKKAMPMAAKRAKVTRSRQDRKRKQKIAGKQFRGRKAWK